MICLFRLPLYCKKQLYYPLYDQDDLQTWHFTVRGPPDTPFENGLFHGAIYVPDTYPWGPPKVEFFTVISNDWLFDI